MYCIRLDPLAFLESSFSVRERHLLDSTVAGCACWVWHAFDAFHLFSWCVKLLDHTCQCSTHNTVCRDIWFEALLCSCIACASFMCIFLVHCFYVCFALALAAHEA